MNSRFVTIEEHECVLDQLRLLRLENKELKNKVALQKSTIFDLETSLFQAKFNEKTENSSTKTQNSAKSSFYKSRSGSAQSKKPLSSMFCRSSRCTGLESLNLEIKKAENLRDKAYDDYINNQGSPTKANRFKSLLERWELEITILKNKRQELIEFN